jgi:hypothetical protein
VNGRVLCLARRGRVPARALDSLQGDVEFNVRSTRLLAEQKGGFFVYKG